MIALILCLFLSVAADSQTDRSAASESQAETDLVHFGDLLDVDVVGSLEYDWRGPINPEGFIDGIDAIQNPVYALCRSEGEISDDLAKEFSSFLRDPKVVVRIVDRSRRAEAIVDGAVRTPYRFQIRRPVKLSELIILSGGITDRSSGEITIFRPESLSCAGKTRSTRSEAFLNTSESGGTQMTTIRIADLLSGRPEANPQILSGDIVTVSEAAPIYMIGGVNNPRPISSRSKMTLSRAIDSAGGLSKDALEDKVTIYRRKSGSSQIINADLAKIKAKQAEDIVLSPYDIVDVGEKGREKRRFPPRIDSDDAPGGRISLGLRIID